MPKKFSANIVRTYLAQSRFKIFELVGERVYCKKCSSNVACTSKHEKQCLEPHLNSKKNQKMCDLFGRESQPPISSALSLAREKQKSLDEFNLDLTTTFLKCDIPLNKVMHPAFKSFIEKYMKKPLYTRQALEKDYLPAVFQADIEKIRAIIGDHPVYFTLEETRDRINRNVINILVGPLNGQKTRSYLLSTEMHDSCDSTVMAQAFHRACEKLWPAGIRFDKVLLALTDQAPYMIKCFTGLKNLQFSKMHHVTCLVHAIHRACEKIREDHPILDHFIGGIKKALSYSNERRKRFISIAGKLPPQTIQM